MAENQNSARVAFWIVFDQAWGAKAGLDAEISSTNEPERVKRYANFWDDRRLAHILGASFRVGVRGLRRLVAVGIDLYHHDPGGRRFARHGFGRGLSAADTFE
jgi:hypothetical protein